VNSVNHSIKELCTGGRWPHFFLGLTLHILSVMRSLMLLLALEWKLCPFWELKRQKEH